MEYIKEVESIIVTSKAGNKKLRKQGIFKCPVCFDEVIKEYSNGLKAVSCGGAACKDTCPTAKYHFTQPYYNTWAGMKARCADVSDKDYGGKGITYDIKWETFNGFWEDMANGWFLGGTIERKDPNKNYCLENCEWITQEENTYRAHHRPVNKVDMETGEILKMYPSVTAAVEAGEAPNTSQISRAARGERSHYLGYAWHYPTDHNKRREYEPRPKNLITNASNPIYSTWANTCFRYKGSIDPNWLTESGVGFRQFIADMNSTYFEGAYLVRRNKELPFTKDNCFWESKAEATGRNRQRAVEQLDKITGAVLKEWASIKEAAIALSIDPSSMTKVCKGKKKTAGNFIWKYKEVA